MLGAPIQSNGALPLASLGAPFAPLRPIRRFAHQRHSMVALTAENQFVVNLLDAVHRTEM